MHGRIVSNPKFRVSGMKNCHGSGKHHFWEQYDIKHFEKISILIFSITRMPNMPINSNIIYVFQVLSRNIIFVIPSI